MSRLGGSGSCPSTRRSLARVGDQRCVGDLGLRGIKLGPNYQDFDPLGSPASAVYEQAQAKGLPILFHGGASPIRSAPLRYAHPLVFDEIAIRFPDLRMVIAHLGHPWQADTLVVIRKHPNVFADLSASFYRPVSAPFGDASGGGVGGAGQAPVRIGLPGHDTRRGRRRATVSGAWPTPKIRPFWTTRRWPRSSIGIRSPFWVSTGPADRTSRVRRSATRTSLRVPRRCGSPHQSHTCSHRLPATRRVRRSPTAVPVGPGVGGARRCTTPRRSGRHAVYCAR